jgi:hypothetical protein
MGSNSMGKDRLPYDAAKEVAKEEGILPNEAHFGLRKSFANRVSVAVLGGLANKGAMNCTPSLDLAWVPCRLKLFPCFFAVFTQHS